MDKDDRMKIYRLLSNLYPRSKALKDAEARTAWGMVLQKYTYEDVKSAVLDYTATHNFAPDLCDIVGGLTPIEAAEDEKKDDGPPSCFWENIEWMKRFIEENPVGVSE